MLSDQTPVVTVAGVESSHPDLNVVEFVDFFDTRGSTNYNKDGNGHGTHVAGEANICFPLV